MTSERLDAVEKEVLHHPDPVVSASEVVDALEDDVSRRTVLDDLRVLERAGALESKETGARAVAWWHVDRVTPAPPRDPADHPDQRALEETVGDVDAQIAEADVDAETIMRDLEADVAIDSALEGWRPGRSLEDRRERREVGRRALAWLRSEDGPRTRSEFVAALYEATSLEGQGEDSWWRRLVRPALEVAMEHGAVDQPGRADYRWVD